MSYRVIGTLAGVILTVTLTLFGILIANTMEGARSAAMLQVQV